MTRPDFPTALIADDEPLLRQRLTTLLEQVWPELRVVHQARNGREAIEMMANEPVQVVFLDVHMPGIQGVEAAAQILQGASDAGLPRPAVVFVTAFEQYAIRAFEQGAVDYLLKPIEDARLAECVKRLQEWLSLRQAQSAMPAGLDPAWLHDLAKVLQGGVPLSPKQEYLQWLRASVGQMIRLIPVDSVYYIHADAKYTQIVYDGGEALIRKTIKELSESLDPRYFQQIHRSTIVNLRAIDHITRTGGDSAIVHLKGSSRTLDVSRSYLHLFRQM
ncbi:MAG: response regulator transcription factor [Burkholderiaceae bacterium]|nr:MAG: response regulator transcription factor [Burkholderiaceae bacterium]